MSKVREILRLANIGNISSNSISKSVGCSHNTVKDILRRAQEAGLTWSIVEKMDDAEIEIKVYGDKKSTVPSRPEPDLTYINKELRRSGVNLMLLWHEYKIENPDGLQYTRFCDRYRKWAGIRQVSLHIKHKAGEKMFVDWAGDTMQVIAL